VDTCEPLLTGPLIGSKKALGAGVKIPFANLDQQLRFRTDGNLRIPWYLEPDRAAGKIFFYQRISTQIPSQIATFGPPGTLPKPTTS